MRSRIGGGEGRRDEQEAATPRGAIGQVPSLWHRPGEGGTVVAIWRETPHTAEKEKRNTLASLFLPPSHLLPVPSIGGIQLEASWYRNPGKVAR